MAQSQADLLSTLKALHRDKLTIRERHVAVAKHVDHYDFNNTYQYVINREDTHLSWLEAAIRELNGSADDLPEATVPSPGKKGSFTPLVAQDAKEAAALVSNWRGKVDAITNVRHRKMVDVILGETLEHERFFSQIAAGNELVLGRRLPGAGTGHGVLPERWME